MHKFFFRFYLIMAGLNYQRQKLQKMPRGLDFSAKMYYFNA